MKKLRIKGDKMKKEEDKDIFYCQKCGEALSYFSGLEQIPEFLFCLKCNDVAYDINDGKVLFELE